MARGGVVAAAGRFSRHAYFPQADWLWNALPSSPVLDSNSATWVGYLSASGTQHICDLIEFGVGLRGPGGSAGSAITSSTPRFDVAFRQATGGGGDNWGPDPFSTTMPWPADLAVPGMALGETVYDGHIAVADPTFGRVYSVWRANATARSGWWGRETPLYGDGRESGAASSGSSTGARLSRYAGVIRSSEMTAAHAAGDVALPHALFFSTD